MEVWEAAIAYQDLNEEYESEIGIATAVVEQAYKVLNHGKII